MTDGQLVCQPLYDPGPANNRSACVYATRAIVSRL